MISIVIIYCKGRFIKKNRKLLIEGFKKYSTHSDYNGISKYVTFEQAKKAIEEVLRSSFDNGVSDQKIECLLYMYKPDAPSEVLTVGLALIITP